MLFPYELEARANTVSTIYRFQQIEITTFTIQDRICQSLLTIGAAYVFMNLLVHCFVWKMHQLLIQTI